MLSFRISNEYPCVNKNNTKEINNTPAINSSLIQLFAEISNDSRLKATTVSIPINIAETMKIHDDLILLVGYNIESINISLISIYSHQYLIKNNLLMKIFKLNYIQY